MNRDEVLGLIQSIGTIENDVERRTKLTELTNTINGVYDNIDTLNTNINTLNSNLENVNKELDDAQKANMQLYLQVTQTSKKEESPIPTEETPKLKFEDLFKK